MSMNFVIRTWTGPSTGFASWCWSTRDGVVPAARRAQRLLLESPAGLVCGEQFQQRVLGVLQCRIFLRCGLLYLFFPLQPLPARSALQRADNGSDWRRDHPWFGAGYAARGSAGEEDRRAPDAHLLLSCSAAHLRRPGGLDVAARAARHGISVRSGARSGRRLLPDDSGTFNQ